jgi:hypothetical protein
LAYVLPRCTRMKIVHPLLNNPADKIFAIYYILRIMSSKITININNKSIHKDNHNKGSDLIYHKKSILRDQPDIFYKQMYISFIIHYRAVHLKKYKKKY